MQKLSRKLTAKTLGFLLIPVLFLFFSTPKAGAVVGLSVGNDQLNLTGGQNVFYGVTSASNTAGSFLLLEKGYGNVVFKIDYAGNITTNGSVLGANNYWGFSGNNLFASSTAWNVGIGTTSPYSKLHLFDNTTGPIISLSGLNTNYRGLTVKDTGNSEQWFSGANNVNNFVIRRSGTTDNLTIASTTGYVGIGITNPREKTDIVGALRVGSDGKLTAYSVSGGSCPGCGTEAISLQTTIDNRTVLDGLPFSEESRHVLALQPSFGRVGIGTTSPATKLHVFGSQMVGDGSQTNFLAGSSFQIQKNSGNATAMSFWQNGVASSIIGHKASDSNLYITNNYFNPGLGSATSSITLNNAGNVGIGSTTPNIKLSVSNGSTGNVIDVGGANIGGLASTPTNPDQAVPLGYLQNNYNATSTSLWSGSLAGNISNANSGNVGIGTTNPVSKLSVVGGLNFSGVMQAFQTLSTYNNLASYYIANNITGALVVNTNIDVADTGAWVNDLSLSLYNYTGAATQELIDIAFYKYYNGGTGVPAFVNATYVRSGSINPTVRLAINSSNKVVVIIGDTTSTWSYPQLKVDKVITNINTLSKFAGWAVTGGVTDLTGYTIMTSPSQKNIVVAQSILNTGGYTQTGSSNNIFSGNVGIGSTTPNIKLSVSNGSTGNVIDVGGANIGGLASTPTNPDQAVPLIYLQNNYNATSTSFWSGSLAGNISNANSGNVGIGTTNPNDILHIASSTSAYLNINNTSSGVAGIKLQRGYWGYSDYTDYSLYNSSGNFYLDQTISTGVATRLFIQDTTGSVGIGTTAPKNKLDVAGGMALGSYAGVNTAPSNSLIVSGNIGINSTTPNYRLSISSSTADVINVGGGFVSGLNSTPINRDQAIPLGYLQDNYTSTSTINSTLFWGGSLSGNIYSANTGNVGVGTTNPFAKLEIDITSPDTNQPTAITGITQDAHTFAFFSDKSQATGRKAGIQFGNWSNGASKYAIGGIFSVMTNAAGNTVGDLTFDTRKQTSDTLLTEAMRITSGGNVGIGTTSPAAKLHVYGNGTYAASFTNGNVGIGTTVPGGKLEVYGGDVKINGGNLLLADIAGQTTTKLQSYNNASGLWLVQPTSQSLILADSISWDRGLSITYTAGTTGAVGGLLRIGQLTRNAATYTHGETALFTNGLERMRINSLGKVGIGSTTPSVPLSFGASTGDVIDVAGGFITGLSSTQYIRSQAVSLGYLQDNYFSYWNPSPADSNNIYNNNLGNVGIGTTTPAAKFQLNGGLILKHATVADTDYTASTTDYIIAYSSITANRTVTLPNSLCTPGRFFVVLDESGSASASKQIIIDPEGTTKIVGQNTFILGNPYNSVYVFCGNSAWYVL